MQAAREAAHDAEAMPEEFPDRILKTADVLRILGTSNTTYRRWIKQGKLPPPRFGGQPESVLRRLLSEK